MRSSLPVGEKVDFTPRLRPAREPLRGSYVLVCPLDADNVADPLYAASHPPAGDPGIWTYLFDGPFGSVEEMHRWLVGAQASEDPLFFTLAPLPAERPCGVASYLRITPESGVIEIGNIWFGSPMQRTSAATESIYLMARHVFEDLGYRRLEWKCNALNAASRRAAERFGFTFEGVFRKHMVIKGRNRDTAWYAITDDEWRVIRTGFERWLQSENFDSRGLQRRSLADLIGEAPL